MGLPAVVIFSVGSPLAVDVEATLVRSGRAVAAAVRNRAGDSWLMDPSALVDLVDAPASLRDLPFIVPLFTPANRWLAVAEAVERGFSRPATLVDPSVPALVGVDVGEGVYVNAGCAIGSASVLGRFVLLNRAAAIGHHARLGAFVSVGPGAVLGGHVTVGQGALIGIGATVLPKVTVGAHAVVGGGAVVSRDVPANCVVVGNPARVVRDGLPDGFPASLDAAASVPDDHS